MSLNPTEQLGKQHADVMLDVKLLASATAAVGAVADQFEAASSIAACSYIRQDGRIDNGRWRPSWP